MQSRGRIKGKEVNQVFTLTNYLIFSYLSHIMFIFVVIVQKRLSSKLIIVAMHVHARSKVYRSAIFIVRINGIK